MKIATGKTYSVKEDLKKVGFEWNPKEKRFEAEKFDEEAWFNKYCSLSWNGRKQGRLCQEINIIDEAV